MRPLMMTSAILQMSHQDLLKHDIREWLTEAYIESTEGLTVAELLRRPASPLQCELTVADLCSRPSEDIEEVLSQVEQNSQDFAKQSRQGDEEVASTVEDESTAEEPLTVCPADSHLQGEELHARAEEPFTSACPAESDLLEDDRRMEQDAISGNVGWQRLAGQVCKKAEITVGCAMFYHVVPSTRSRCSSQI
eukprot:symbB.v1.2.005398.t1/scaffold316.1/size230253/13